VIAKLVLFGVSGDPAGRFPFCGRLGWAGAEADVG
jgi:hypothetical protein